jgi:hypothetical protein
VKLRKIVSGGQSGVDQGALRAGRDSFIETGGWAPKEYLTEDGKQPSLLVSFGLEDSGLDYPKRTILNIKDSDGTLIIHDRRNDGLGTKLTIKICEQLGKPHFEVWLIDEADQFIPFVIDWLNAYEIEVLNVAGGRESRHPGIGNATYNFMMKVFGRR